MVIGVDTKKPVGKTSIEGPEPVDINGDKWFDKDQIIEFRVDADQMFRVLKISRWT